MILHAQAKEAQAGSPWLILCMGFPAMTLGVSPQPLM